MKLDSIVVAIVGLLSTAIGYFIGTKQLYVDIVVKNRVQAIESFRHSLRDLYYYTNSRTIELAIQRGEKFEHIQNLLKSQSSLEYRLLEVFYPDGSILDNVRKLIEQAIRYTESEIKDSQYDQMRNESLKLLKLYNFSSWQYAQHSTGRRGSSVKGFDKSFVKTLKSLEQDPAVKKAIERGLIRYRVLH